MDEQDDHNDWIDEEDDENVAVIEDDSEDEVAEDSQDTDAARIFDALIAQNFPALRTGGRSVGNTSILTALTQLLGGGTQIRIRRYEDDDDDEYREQGWTNDPSAWYDKVEGPQEAGVQLLQSGEFGQVLGYNPNELEQKSLRKTLLERQMGRGRMDRETIARPLVPNSNGTIVATYGSNPYAGQYSHDSSFYYTCEQDFQLHVYDTSGPPSAVPKRDTRFLDHQTTLKLHKSFKANPGSWTITDSHLSPDNERLIYASITPTVYMVKLWDAVEDHVPIHFSDEPRHAFYTRDRFGIWSCRFSADGNEIVAGGSGQLFVYNLEQMRRTVRIPAHADDVNSCCWADPGSGNVLISGSDDTFIKVWDRRSLGHHAKPAGVLIGHTEGITYVSSKGDGRYIISNAKDQSLRLWDLRKMRSNDEFEDLPNRSYGLGGHYDYRHGTYRRPNYTAHPNDCSVMTYRGHAVLQTLIRCHFSPAETTGSSYIYSGSTDGKIHVWSLDGQVVQVLDRSQARPMSQDPSAAEPASHAQTASRSGRRFRSRTPGCVRDVSWHSGSPVLMSVAWGEGGDWEPGTVAMHEWKGLGKNGMILEDVVDRERLEEIEGRRGGSRVPGAWDE
jgi:WD repeat-containing protein 23